jgi:hypothetical protein
MFGCWAGIKRNFVDFSIIKSVPAPFVSPGSTLDGLMAVLVAVAALLF